MMETTGDKWLEEAESSLRLLRDVQAASILAESGTIREIHILANAGRSAKQIVRDIETCLRTRFGLGIDHRVVSVAFTRPSPAAEKPPAPAAEPVEEHPSAPPGTGRPEATGLEPKALEPKGAEARPAPPGAEPRPQVGAAPARGYRPPEDMRIRFAGVNLYVAGPRVQAQVELRWKGIGRMGSATGWSSRDGAYRLIAQATLAAVQEFLEEAWALSLQDIEFIRLGRHEVVIVGLSLITHRHEKILAGCCPVEQDAQQAVVLATLGAVNRVVGGLPTREPTEFVLRPASRQEESEAKKD